MESSLNKSKNFYRCIGTVYEKGFKREDCKVKIYEDGKPTGEEVNAECIKGKFTVRANNSLYTFPVYFASKALDGKDSSQWEMALSMLNWNAEVNGNGESPTLVQVEGRIEDRPFVSRDKKSVKSSVNFRVSKASTSVKADAAHGMTVLLTGYVQNIAPETKTVDGEAEETGRGLLNIFVANSKGQVFPVPVIVPEEYVDDVNDMVEKTNTVDLELDVNVITSGNVEKKKKAIGGHGKVDTNTAYSRTELVMAGLDIVEEPDELTVEDEDGNEVEVKTNWMNPVAVKKAIKAYQMRMDELLKSGGNSANKDEEPSSRNFKERKAANKGKTLGKRTADLDEDEDRADDEDEDDLPFNYPSDF